MAINGRNALPVLAGEPMNEVEVNNLLTDLKRLTALRFRPALRLLLVDTGRQWNINANWITN
jgi:hypothetical protein